MRLIAHRGLITGPDRKLENHPLQISKAIELGFDCEIDVHLIDNNLYLGHDEPEYLVDEYWLRTPGLWIHCKNVQALMFFNQHKNWNYTYFWHQEDDYTLTSNGYIWTYPKKELGEKSICLMPEWHDPEFKNINFNCFGICSDYVVTLKELIGTI